MEKVLAVLKKWWNKFDAAVDVENGDFVINSEVTQEYMKELLSEKLGDASSEFYEELRATIEAVMADGELSGDDVFTVAFLIMNALFSGDEE